MSEMPEELWALDGKPENRSSEITIKEYSAEIVNGKIKAVINNIGKIILEDHISHCLVDAVETGDEQVIRDLNDAIDKFVK